MNISVPGIIQIKTFEGLSLKPYFDNGYYSIGYGHQIQPDELNLMAGITQQKADELFLFDLAKYVSAVNEYLEVDVTQAMFDSLVSFAYNIGISGFANSDLLAAINAQEAPETIKNIWKTNWVTPSVLAVRRSKEADFAFTDYSGNDFEYYAYENTTGTGTEKRNYFLPLAIVASLTTLLIYKSYG